MTSTAYSLDKLEALGFDYSIVTGKDRFRVRCSQCESLVINGFPSHENGCPNERLELACKWCGQSFIQDAEHYSCCSHSCSVDYSGQFCDCEECDPVFD